MAFFPARSIGSIVQFAVQRRSPFFPETTTLPLSEGTTDGELIRLTPRTARIKNAINMNENDVTERSITVARRIQKFRCNFYCGSIRFRRSLCSSEFWYLST